MLKVNNEYNRNRSGVFTVKSEHIPYVNIISKEPEDEQMLYLTLSWRRLDKSMDCFLHDNGLRHERVKGALSGLRQFSVNKTPLKMMKNVFYFTLKALFILKIFKFLSWLYGHV